MAIAKMDDYFRLVRRFPLVPIRNDKHLTEAGRMVSELARRYDQLTPGESDYFEVLTDLIGTYEKEHDIFPAEKMAPAEALEHLMGEHGLSQHELARLTGISRTVLTEFLNGKRGLSKESALKLAQHFKVAMELFLVDADRRRGQHRVLLQH